MDRFMTKGRKKKWLTLAAALAAGALTVADQGLLGSSARLVAGQVLDVLAVQLETGV